MAQYLSEQWFDEMQSAASAFSPEVVMTGRVSVREIVSDAPAGAVSYVMVLEDGKAEFVRADHTVADDTVADDTVADVTFAQTYETAVALHKGELTIHEAFFAGRVRVSGHLNTLLENSDSLQGLTSIFESVRTATTY